MVVGRLVGLPQLAVHLAWCAGDGRKMAINGGLTMKNGGLMVV